MGAQNKVLDLGLGNPLFLQAYWRQFYFSTEILPSSHMAYGAHGGSPELKRAIQNLHRHISNAEINDRHIVIGYGATQILSAAVATLPRGGDETVYIRSPFYFKTPSIVNQTGFAAITKYGGVAGAEVLARPSNPTLELHEPTSKGPVIYDLCYNWPTYVTPEKADHDLMVFSLSKSLGHAGNRTGWALVRDAERADAMNTFIENATGGVSRDSQQRATDVIKSQVHILDQNLKHEEPQLQHTVFEYGKRVLDSRWERLRKLDHPKLKILNDGGMFLWGQYPGGVLALEEDFNIIATSGLQCGGAPNQVRINVGCDDHDFDELMKRLVSEP